MNGFRRSSGSAALVAALLASASAWADAPPPAPPAPPTTGPAPVPFAPADGTVSAARAAFQEGVDLAAEARWAEALAAFLRSERLRPHAVTVYNVGYCELSLGHYTRAKKSLRAALAERDAAGARTLPDDLRNAAEAYLVQVEPSTARVHVTVDPPTAKVTVDGRPLELVAPVPGSKDAAPIALAGTRDAGPGEPIADGKIDVELDPGDHTFGAAQGDGAPSTVLLGLSMGARQELALKAPPPSLAASLTPGSPPPPGPAPAPVGADTTVAAAGGPSRVPAYIVLGIGAAGIVTGSIAGIVALSKKPTLERECTSPDKWCGAGEPTSTLDSANTAATISTISFGIGAAGALVGGYLWWTLRPTEDRAHATIVPALGYRSAGVMATF